MTEKIKVGDIVYFGHTTLNSYKFWEVVGTEGDWVDVLGVYNHEYKNTKTLGFVLRTKVDLLEKVTRQHIESEANEHWRAIKNLYEAFNDIEQKRMQREQKTSEGAVDPQH